MSKRKPLLGLALGSGSARGWAHIGVLRALEARGMVPDIVAGCSIGAFVGAAYVNGDLDKLEAWVSKLYWKDVVGLLDVSFNGGLIKGEKLVSFFTSRFVDHDFSELAKPFACVATDLETGREIWLREGSVADAVRVSIGMGVEGDRLALPSMLEVMSGSLNIMQTRSARSRLAGEPAEVVLAPRLAQLGMMDYHRGPEAIAEGQAEVERMWPAILHALEG